MNFFSDLCDWVEVTFYFHLGKRLKEAARKIPVIFGLLEFILGIIAFIVMMTIKSLRSEAVLLLILLPFISVFTVCIFAIIMIPVFAKGEQLEKCSQIPEINEKLNTILENTKKKTDDEEIKSGLHCTYCYAEMKVGAKVCEVCGKTQNSPKPTVKNPMSENKCPNCGKEKVTDEKICPFCGWNY